MILTLNEILLHWPKLKYLSNLSAHPKRHNYTICQRFLIPDCTRNTYSRKNRIVMSLRSIYGEMRVGAIHQLSLPWRHLNEICVCQPEWTRYRYLDTELACVSGRCDTIECSDCLDKPM